MSASYADFIAQAEDGRITWFARDGVTKAQARRAVVNECLEPVSNFTVRAGWLRPADCPIHKDSEDADYEDVVPEDCECWAETEDWLFECERTHPEAIAAWRVEAK